ncbi:MAG: DNA-directed RNA polymerase subunit L [Candidatus Verstraetearchaeota archaeon]|nr:DNA-directed RNA polymerase subunit L [Candidatus Verstraetearchaeota archaeon]
MKVLKRVEEENYLEVEIKGEDHTVGNLLRTLLLEDPSVRYAGYRVDHPLVGNLVVAVRTDGSKSPIQAIVEALEKAEARVKEFKEAFMKAERG